MQLHTVSGYIQNIFLIEYEHGCLLLDGCSVADVPVLQDFFQTTLNRPFSDLKTVIVTHMHPDHAGGAHKLRDITGCNIVTGTFEKQWYSGLKGFVGHLIDIALATWVAGRLGKKRRFIWYSRCLSPDFLLDDGESVPEFPDWKIVATPGHTDRDISVFHQGSGLLYLADLVVRVKGKLAPPFPVYFPNHYKDSLVKVAELPAKTLLMAHVPAIHFQAEKILEVLKSAPNKPKTNWNAIKGKVKRVLKRTKRR